MKRLRINRIQVGIAGLAVMIGIAAIFLLAFVRPRAAEIATINTRAEGQEQFARTEGPKAKKSLEEAKQQEAVVRAQFDQIMKARMPNVDLSDPIAGMFRLWDLPREEGMLIDRWFRSSGALVSGYSFPGFGTTPADPNMRVLPPLNWNLSVQVRGFPELLDWLLKIPKAPRFMVMQSVTIQGARQPGQPLNASVPVVVYLWTRAAQTALEAKVTAAAPGEAGGGPGAMGGGMGGGRGGGMGGGRGGGMGGGRGGGMGGGRGGGMGGGRGGGMGGGRGGGMGGGMGGGRGGGMGGGMGGGRGGGMGGGRGGGMGGGRGGGMGGMRGG